MRRRAPTSLPGSPAGEPTDDQDPPPDVDAEERGEPSALSDADERMYGYKRPRRNSALAQTTAVRRSVQDAVFVCDAFATR